MKHLLTGVAVAAALAIAAPVWAQNPSGGNGMGMPGPNPGGGGNLTPYSDRRCGRCRARDCRASVGTKSKRWEPEPGG